MFCLFNGNGTGFVFIARDAILHSLKNPLDLNLISKDRSKVLIRVLLDTGAQRDTVIEQLDLYNDRDLTLMVNEHTGFERVKNADSMGPEYVYLGILDLETAGRIDTKQGFMSNGQEVSFTNCDGKPNGYFVFYPLQETPIRGSQGSLLVTRWRQSSVAVANDSLLPADTFTYLIELHFGGCGAFETSNNWRGVLGGAIGLPFTYSSCGYPAPVAGGSRKVSGTLFGDHVVYVCRRGYRHVTGNLSRECSPDRGWTGESPVCERVKCPVPTLLPRGTKLTLDPPDGDYRGILVGQCIEGWTRRKGRVTRRCLQTGRWSGKPLVCHRIECGQPDPIPFAEMRGKSFRFSDIITYTCLHGYRSAGGALSRTCMAKGNWSGETPECSRVSCGHPGNISHGDHLGESYLFEDVVTYFCNPGYITSDDVTLQCTANGTWDKVPPYCQKLRCSDPPEVEHARWSGEVRYKDTIVYTCDHGYHVTSDMETLQCNETGGWSGELPICELIISCGHPGNISHGELLGESYLFEDVVTYFCNHGYITSDEVKLKCVGNGTWDGSPPSCQSVSCGHPGITSHGEHFGTSYMFGDVVTFFCYPGYMTSDEVRLQCMANGMWDKGLPSCERVRCTDPPEVDNAWWLGEFSYRDTIVYHCNYGYHIISGLETLKCNENGVWSGELPICERVSCGHPGNISHGDHLGASYLFGDAVTYVCHPGYITSDDVTLQCMGNRTWDKGPPRCQRLRCSDPPEVEHARWSGEVKYRDTIVYTCNYGYHITSGLETLRCNENGSWSGEMPTCKRVSCGHPGLTSAGSHQGESYLFGDVVTFFCHPGHITPDDVTLTCQASGTWDGPAPTCDRLTCNDPPEIEHAGWTGETRYQDTVTYTCNPGYHITSGTATMRCNKQGNWSGEPPVCGRVSCGDPGQVANAHYSGKYLYEDRVLYVCDEGYVFTGGDAILVCQANGKWQGKRLVCEEDKNPSNVPVYCPPATTVHNATWETTDSYLVPVNTLVSYVCHEHHEFPDGETRKSIVCLGSGKWNKEPGHCDLKRCPPLPVIRHGHVVRADPVVFSWHVTSCDVGHVFPDGSRVRSVYCHPDKTWSSAVDHCQPIPCPEVQVPPRVTRLPPEVNETKHQDDHYACPEGTRSEIGTEVQVTSCGSKGLWARPLTNCTAEGCFAPPMVENATLVQYGVHAGASAHFRCRRGSRFPSGLETHEITCLGRDWDETVVQPCSVTNCPVPPDLPDATLHAADYFYSGTVIRYDCHYGYWFSPDSHQRALECLASGVWDQEVGRCQQILCPDPVALTGALTNASSRTVDTEVTLTCPQGQRFLRGQRSLLVTCLLTGQWSHLPDTCRAARCPPVPKVTYADYSTLVVDRGTTVQVTCLPGYELTTGGTGFNLVCGADDEWQGVVSNCTAIYCGPAPSLPFASTNQTGPYFGDSAVLSCIPGYQFEDGVSDLDLRCQEDSSWSLNLSTTSCQPLHCPPIPYVGNATPSAVTTVYNSTMTYTCLHGYWSPWDKAHYVTTRCAESGRWEPAVHNCLEIECPPVPVWLPIVPSTSHRRFATLLNYTCPANTSFATGESWRLANCTLSGQWMPAILPCIDIPDNTTIPPKEAAGSGAIGTFAIVIVSVVFGSIVLLDILTLQKDLHILRDNLSHCLPWLAEPEPANGHCQCDHMEMVPLMTHSPNLYAVENNTSSKGMMAAFDHPDVKLFHGSSNSGLLSASSGELDYQTVHPPPSDTAGSTTSLNALLTKSPVILKPNRLSHTHSIPFVEGDSADAYLREVSIHGEVLDSACPLADDENWDEEIDYPLSVYDIQPEIITSHDTMREGQLSGDVVSHTASQPDCPPFTITPLSDTAENAGSPLSVNTEGEEEEEDSRPVKERLQNGTTSALSGSPL